MVRLSTPGGCVRERGAGNGASDLLYGLEAIASYLRMTHRQAKHRALQGQIPTFKIGRNVCARRAGLNA